MRSLMILASTIALAACNMAADAQENEGGKGGGRIAQRSFEVGSFNAVSLAGPHDVIVTVGGAPSVRADGDADSIDKLDIRVENGSLRIGQKKGSNWNMNLGRKRGVTVYVTAPALNAAAIGGSGDMKIDTVEGARFQASIGGSGDMQVASLRVERADFSIAGSGGIRAAGSAATSKVSIAGSGDVDLGRLESRDASVSVVGSGDASVRATQSAKVSVMGSGDVSVSGSAKCTVSKMGSGNVTCEA